MKIGLVDVDSHNFPNLPLMKISAYHKSKGDTVEFCHPIFKYDRIYVSKTFGDEYSQLDSVCLQADEIIYGGSGFAKYLEHFKYQEKCAVCKLTTNHRGWLSTYADALEE